MEELNTEIPSIDLGGLTMDDLNTTVSKSETSRDMFADTDQDVPHEDLTFDMFEEAKRLDDIIDVNKEETKTSAPKIDTTDYTVPEGAKYIMLESKPLVKCLSQLSTVIELNSPRAVSRGISIKVIDDKNIDVICPNELYYFKTSLEAESTVDAGSIIFIEYMFLTKIARFIPPKVLIYSMDETVGAQTITKYYIRLTTGDLELINTNLIDSDIKRLNFEFDILMDKPMSILNTDETYRKISTMIKLLPFESDSPRRRLHAHDNLTSFRSALIFSCTDLNLPNIQLDIRTANYLMKACQHCGTGETLMFVPTTSETIPRHAIVYGNTVMVTNYASTNEDPKLKEVLTELPDMTVVDYSQLKYQLDYATSITYAMGTVTFENSNGTLLGKLKLQNGSESPIEIPTSGKLNIPEGTKFKVNTKTLLTSLNSLDPSLETSLGFKNGILYLTNSDIKIALVTI